MNTKEIQHSLQEVGIIAKIVESCNTISKVSPL
jgi:hypothetical protein